MAKRAFIYARYSSDNQLPSSIDDQFRICRERAEREGWTVVGYYSDEAITAASMKRPGLQAMLADVRAGRAEVVLAEALDRLVGDMEYGSHLFKRLSIAGVELHTVSEGPISDLQIGILTIFASMRPKQISEKTHRGMTGKALNGQMLGTNLYGYRTVKTLGPDGEVVRGQREIVPEEAAIINRIAREYADELKPPLRIAAQLNAEGIPGPGGRKWNGEMAR